MNFRSKAALIAGLLLATVSVMLVDHHSTDPASDSGTNDKREVSANQPASRVDSEAALPPSAEPPSFTLRNSFVDGSLKELLEREMQGDPEAAYELVARTIECIQSTSTRACSYYLASQEESISRLKLAADNGVIAAQVHFLDNLSMLDPEAGTPARYSAYLKQALAEGSADAMYLLGLMELGSSSGGPRRDVDVSKTGLSRLDAVAYLVASAEVYSAVMDSPYMRENAELELDKLDARESRIVREKIASLLGREECCFVLKRTSGEVN